MFKDIIGYDKVKKSLERVIDVLNNKDKYKELGCVIPHGLLLYGEPGLGKSTFAFDMINSVNRKSYVIRKNKSDGSFINYLNKVFDDAKDSQPSIILLDDIDKFSEDDGKDNNEEFVTVQSLIDDIRDMDIFVIATANNKYALPKSLLRSGRFDIKIKIDYPKEKDSLEIMKYYLSNKKLDDDVNIKNISYILGNFSCADLEKVCNQAGLYAGFNNKKKIGMEELLIASLELEYGTNIDDINKNDKYDLEVSYHEAGHALVGELLEPGSVSFITVMKTDSDTRGATKYHSNDYYYSDIKYMENRVITLLAGKAATEIIYHKCDVGTNSDLKRAYNIVSSFVDGYCMLDFNSWIRNIDEQSEMVKESKDNNINKMISKYYDKALELLLSNRDKLEILANVLNKKKILFQDEIENIINNPLDYKV